MAVVDCRLHLYHRRGVLLEYRHFVEGISPQVELRIGTGHGNHRARFHVIFSVEQVLQLVVCLIDRDIGKIAEMTRVDAEDRYLLFPDTLRRAQKRAVASDAESYRGVEVVAFYEVVDFRRGCQH